MTDGSLPPLDLNNLSIPSGLKGRLKWVILAAILIGLFFALSMGRGILADWLWFGELGFRGIFLKVILTKIILFTFGFAVTAIQALACSSIKAPSRCYSFGLPFVSPASSAPSPTPPTRWGWWWVWAAAGSPPNERCNRWSAIGEHALPA